MSKMQTEYKTSSSTTAKQFIELCINNKHEEISAFLKKTTQDDINAIIHTRNDEAFRDAAWYDCIKVIKLLLEYTPDLERRNKMIHSNKDEAFHKASSMAHRGNHAKIVKLLVELTPDNTQLKQMIHNNKDAAFRYCVGDPSVQGTRVYGRRNCPIGYCASWQDVRELHVSEELIELFLELDIEYYENLAKSLNLSPKTAEYITKTSQEIKETRKAKAHNDADGKKEAVGSHTERYLAKQNNTTIQPNI